MPGRMLACGKGVTPAQDQVPHHQPKVGVRLGRADVSGAEDPMLAVA